MADYSILHERVGYLLYIYLKNELWVYVTHQILQQSCTPFGTKSCFHAHLLAKRVHENRTKGVENKVDDTLKLAVLMMMMS